MQVPIDDRRFQRTANPFGVYTGLGPIHLSWVIKCNIGYHDILLVDRICQSVLPFLADAGCWRHQVAWVVQHSWGLKGGCGSGGRQRPCSSRGGGGNEGGDRLVLDDEKSCYEHSHQRGCLPEVRTPLQKPAPGRGSRSPGGWALARLAQRLL